MHRMFVAFLVCVAVATAGFFERTNTFTGELNSIDIFWPKSVNDEGLVNRDLYFKYWTSPGGFFQKNVPLVNQNYEEPLTIQDVFVKSVFVVVPSQEVQHTFSAFYLRNGLRTLHRYPAFSSLQEFFKRPGLKWLIFYPSVHYNPRFYETMISNIAVQDDMRVSDIANSENCYGKDPYLFVAPEDVFNQMQFEDIVKVSDFKVYDDVIEVQGDGGRPASGLSISARSVKDDGGLNLGSQAEFDPASLYPKVVSPRVQAWVVPKTEHIGGIIPGAYAATIPKINTTAMFQKSGVPHVVRKTIDSNVAHSPEREYRTSGKAGASSLATESEAVQSENLLREEFDDAGYQAEHQEGSSTLGVLIRGGVAVIGNVAGGIVRTGTGIVRNVTSSVVHTGADIIRAGTGIVGNVTSSVVRTGTDIVRTGSGIVGNVTSNVVRTGTGLVRTGTDIVENVGVGLVKTGVEIVKTGAEIAEGVGFGIVHTGSDIVETGTDLVRTGTGVVVDVGSGIVKTGTELVGAVGNDVVEKGTKIVEDVAKIVRTNINETAQNVRNEFTIHHEQLALAQPLSSGNISSRSLENNSTVTSFASRQLLDFPDESVTKKSLFPPDLHV